MTKDEHENVTVIINDHQAALGRKYNEIFQKYHERYNQRDVTRRHRSSNKGLTTATTTSPSNDHPSSEKLRARCQSEPVVLPPIIAQHGRPVAAVTNNYFENTPIRLRIFNNLNAEHKPTKSPRNMSPNKMYHQQKTSVPVPALSHDSLVWNSTQIYERLRRGKRTSPMISDTNDLRSDDAKALLRRTNANRSFRYRKEIGVKQKNDESNKESTTQTFNIREKLEQFREWHEKEYKNKLEHLKQNSTEDVGHLPAIDTDSKGKLLFRNPNDKSSFNTPDREQSLTLHPNMKSQTANNESNESIGENPLASTDDGPSKSCTQRPRRDKAREASAVSWRTWRGVNDSYAYDNVDTYIRDNELLSTEKKNWIQSWVDEALKIREKGMEDVVDSDSTLTDEDENLFP